MTHQHPDLANEQAFIDHAYQCLETSRTDAWKLRNIHEGTLGGTVQARYERDVFDETLVNRLTQLDLGDAALVFGRIDRLGAARPDDEDSDSDSPGPAQVESFHIGRLAVADDNREPVVVDWRAPVAEPFYRATGREPMGLARRRHFAVQGRNLLGIEDELFGEGHLGVGQEDDVEAKPGAGLRGYSTLLAVLERGRTGQLGDIVATIQGEQDEIIRSPQAGVLVVQGGPGTGKTVVALHRAAYLLYTFRFPLEDQGVLVVGPNRVFLRYIERVLPSLGEAGVEQVVLADLVHDVTWGGHDAPLAARTKGDLRMSLVIDKAVTDRERPLREDVVVGFRTGYLRLRAQESIRIVRAELLHDLFGSKALLKLAGEKHLTEAEYLSLYRPRVDDIESVRWSDSDIALLDEARSYLGSRPVKNGAPEEADEIRTYGHIVIDEVQDLTPMQLRMASRRSLNGSMTVVGDIAQATGPLAPNSWDDVVKHLPDRKGSRIIGLSVGYRIPAQIMDVANRVMKAATPSLRPPTAVRQGEDFPDYIHVPSADALGAAVAVETARLVSEIVDGNIAVVAPDPMVEMISAALTAASIKHGRATRTALETGVTVVPVSVVKGLELDGVVVVEPAAIVSDEMQGLRALYVALTRSTRRLSIVHAQPLPAAMLTDD